MNPFELPASSWMVTPVYTVPESTPLSTAARLLDELGVSALPVLDASSRLTGFISRGDLIRGGRLRSGSTPGEPMLWLPNKTVVELMTSSVPVVRPDQPLWACAARMLDHGITRLYVTEDGPLEGVISTRELFRAVVRAEVATPIGELEGPSPTVDASEPLSLAVQQLAQSPEDFIVVTTDGIPSGIFSSIQARVSREVGLEEPVGLWMDASVIALPAATPTCHAAADALRAGRRYVVARDAQQGCRVISGFSFARLAAAEHQDS
ncbi:MAG: CBS domain-containing protein [Deltaproteobacteria bacterium]